VGISVILGLVDADGTRDRDGCSEGCSVGISVNSVTLTVKEPTLTFPKLSVAVTVTVVLPRGKKPPFAALVETWGAGSQSSAAVATKFTLAPIAVALLAMTVRVSGRSSPLILGNGADVSPKMVGPTVAGNSSAQPSFK